MSHDELETLGINNLVTDPMSRLEYVQRILKTTGNLIGRNLEVLELAYMNERAAQTDIEKRIIEACKGNTFQSATEITRYRTVLEYLRVAIPVMKQLDELTKKYGIFIGHQVPVFELKVRPITDGEETNEG